MTLTVFLDSDGVLADFDRRARELLNCDHRRLPDEEMWRRLNEFEDFWHTIPKRYDADELVSGVRELGYEPVIITGCPKSNYDVAEKGKRDFFNQHWPEFTVHTCLSRNKASFMRNPGDILVDDFKSNCKRWAVANGMPIWHKNAKQTLTELKNILGV
jgi:5'-nucleotidase